MFEFLNIGSHTGGEHQHNHAQLTELREKFCLGKYIQARRSQNQSCQQSTHNLGHLKLLCNETQQLGTQQNQCQVHKIMIGHMDSPLQSYGFKYCFFLLAGLYFKTFRVICNSQFAQKPVSILLSFHTLKKDTAG